MIYRCYSETDKDYSKYGAKNIYVDERWHCFENYIKDVVELEGYDEDKVRRNELCLDKDFYLIIDIIV